MCLQEVGDVRNLPEGTTRVDTEVIAGREYQLFIANPALSHRCSVVLLALDLEFVNKHVHVHDFGIIVSGTMHDTSWLLMSLHFPHQQRRDAVDVWERGVSNVMTHLTGLAWDTNVIIGHDLNQDAHSLHDEFVGMLHYREMVFQSGLQTSPPLGSTWKARGSESPIDFFLHQIRGAELRFYKREDLRIALPSDHNTVCMHVTFRSKRTKARRKRPARTLCGKWIVSPDSLWEQIQGLRTWDDAAVARAFRGDGVSRRPQSLRYVDPPYIKDLIVSRRDSKDEWQRTALMQEIHQERLQAKALHKQNLLQEARAGNCRAIAHIRASAAGGQSEGSYVQRCGGVDQATRDLFHFYDCKYRTSEAPIAEPHWQRLAQRHGNSPVAPVTTEEVFAALKGARTGVSAGLDGVTYEGVRHLLSQDREARIPAYFTALIRGEAPIPPSWKRGKIVLLPKVPRPAQAKDLRPICLTPVLCRVFSKVLMARVHQVSPAYTGHQIGCRPGVQALDGILAAQSTLQLLRHSCGAAYAAKIDIKAAFDSLSQGAVFRWLMNCAPASECERLFQLLHGTSVELSLGGSQHVVHMQQGLMQGTAYSADVFSRVLDYFLGPLHERFCAQFGRAETAALSLPHFIVYADDIVLFSDTPSGLQCKLQQIVDVLATLGLQVNPDKSSTMCAHDGSAPGIWLRGRALPLKVEDSLVFLGVPLSHSPNPQLIISHLLRKTSNAYYGFKRIMDCGQAPLATRLLIFNTFITSKWTWASPLLTPNKVALRRLEAAKNTFLLSLFRLPTDPLMGWVDNVVTRRRAVRVICKVNGGPDWRRTWMTRQWAYLGHLARTRHLQPMMKILQAVGTASSGPPVPASWTTDLLIRRVQRIYQTWTWAREIPAWETFARDRTQWLNHAHLWVNHWVPDDAPPTFDYLQEKQVVILKDKSRMLDCFLRPSKDFTEVPYMSPLRVVKPAKLSGPFIWGKADQGRCAVVVSQGLRPLQGFVVHATAPDPTVLAMSVTLLRLAFKVHGILQHQGHMHQIYIPASLLHRSLFHRHVPLSLLADATEALNLLDRQGIEHLWLPPNFKSASPWLSMYHGVDLPRQHTKYLARSHDFSQAFFCEGARQLAESLLQLTG